MRQSKGDGNCAKVSCGERYRGLHYRVVIEHHRNWLQLRSRAALGEIPVENSGAVPGDDTVATEDFFERAPHMGNPVRHAGEAGWQAIAMIFARSADSS